MQELARDQYVEYLQIRRLRNTGQLKLLTSCPYLMAVAPGRVPGAAEPKGKDLCPQLQSLGAALDAVPTSSQRCVLTPMRRFASSSLASKT